MPHRPTVTLSIPTLERELTAAGARGWAYASRFTINPQMNEGPASMLGTPRSISSRAQAAQNHLAERGAVFDFGTSSDGDTPRSARLHTGASSGLASTSTSAAAQQQQSSQSQQPRRHRHPNSSASSAANADPSADADQALPTTYTRSTHEHEQYSTLASTATAKPAMAKKHLGHPGFTASGQAARFNGDPQVREPVGVRGGAAAGQPPKPGAAAVDKAEPIKGVFLVAGSNGVALTGNPAPDVYCFDQNHRDLSGHPGWEVRVCVHPSGPRACDAHKPHIRALWLSFAVEGWRLGRSGLFVQVIRKRHSAVIHVCVCVRVTLGGQCGAVQVTESQPCFLLPCMTKHEVVVNGPNNPGSAYSPDRPSRDRKKPGELFTWDCMCFSLMYGTGKSAKQYSELTRPSKPHVLKDK